MVQGWINDPPVTVEPFQFSPAEPVAYEWSYWLPIDKFSNNK
jgi:hypothetical protein